MSQNSHSNVSEEFEELTSKIIKLGFDALLYSFFPKPLYLSEGVQPLFHFSARYEPYLQRYIEQDYVSRDFVARLALEGRRDHIDWWEEINAGNVTPDELEVTLDGKANFGIQNGLSIPVLFGSYAISGISVISMNEDADQYRKIKENALPKLKKYANDYHAHIVKSKTELLFFIDPLIDSLSEKKKMVVKHLLSGLPMKTIPQTHDITQRFAEKTLITIRQEFGNISTNELLYILGLAKAHERR